MLWSSETWQNSAYKRNSNYGVLYASGHKRKKVQLEMKDSCKATPRAEKQLMKKWIQGNFFCLVRALWKCTESLIEIMQIRYVLADFELSYFLPK